MNTKTFAQEARKILMQGVAKKLLYWGFNEKGVILEQPEKISGGYSFRGEVFDDPAVPNLWHSLQKAITTKSIEVVIEEAAYTWFNRIMALRILVKNGYEEPQLENATGLENTPIILQKARQGKSDFLTAPEKTRLQKILTDYTKDQEAFSILITGYCHSHKTLQRVFGKIDDYTELLLPDNILQTDGFLHLLNSTDAITNEDYQKVELIGWLYQFYISEKKDDVFASFKKGKKAEAKDIPAATQIFTPNWIVKYLVENTAGKIWLNKHPNSPLKTEMKYLVTNDTDKNVIANGSEELIPNTSSLIPTIEDLTLIDPAAGSGHILVEGFDLIYKMYLEEYYTPEEAVESILKNNLYGLDIDDRAVQLATFAVLLKAAKVYPTIWSKNWMPNIYAMPEDELQDWFTTKKYDFVDWTSLQGMQLAEPVTIQWTEKKKNKEIPKKVTFNKGQIINEEIVELLQDHYDKEIIVDFSRELALFWGNYEKPHNYSEFYYTMKLLRQGKNLGSVIKCNISTEVRNHIQTTYANWLKKEKMAGLDIEELAILNTLKNYIPVLLLLTKKYTAVVANPPYMGQKSMNADLKNYVNANYPITKTDLMTIFMEVIPNLTQDNSRFALINLPSWLFLSSFEKIRKNYIDNYAIDSLLHMGRGIFGIDFGSVAFAIKKTTSKKAIGSYFRLHERNFQHILYKDIEKLFLYSNGKVDYKYDFNQYRGEEGITEIPEEGTIEGKKLFYPNFSQANFFKIPGSPIAYWANSNVLDVFEQNESLIKFAVPRQGMATGNNNKFLRLWNELNIKSIGFNKIDQNDASLSGLKWFPYNKGGGFRKWYGSNEYVVNWQNNGKEIKDFKPKSVIRNESYYFKEGMTWTAISSGKFSGRYTDKGFLFDSKGPVLFSYDEKSHNIYMAILNSNVGNYLFQMISPTLDFNQGPLSKIPICEFDFHVIEKRVQEQINISKKDWDSRETSWDFEKSPLLNNTNSLEEAYTIWQQEVTHNFFQLHKNEEELNRIFIDIYGLQDELTPEVALKDITILQEELNKKDVEKIEEALREHGAAAIALPINKAEVISQFISYAIGLCMGRYRLDKNGLHIAHPNPTAAEIANYSYNNGNITIDEDAILPLMGTACNFPDDALQQIYNLLDVIWGTETRTENINFIQECLDKDLEKFLITDFYKYHCNMYKKKPIYWLFSSKKGAFQVLVYMHRMNAFTAEKIRANYLLPHIKNLNSEIALLEKKEANLNTQEVKKLEQLRKNRDECEEYETELKTVADNQITFDLDDGVSVNYKKFETVVAKIK